jgi:hypothetical protein
MLRPGLVFTAVGVPVRDTFAPVVGLTDRFRPADWFVIAHE